MLALDGAAVATETLTALLANERSYPARFVQPRFRENTVAPDAATKPCGERLLVRKSAPLHGAEFRGKQLGVTASDAKDDERAGVADYSRADGVR